MKHTDLKNAAKDMPKVQASVADNQVKDVIQDPVKTDVKAAADAGGEFTPTQQSEGEVLPVPSDNLHQEAKVNRDGANLAPFVSGAPPRPSVDNPNVLVRPQETGNSKEVDMVLKERKLRADNGLKTKAGAEDLNGLDFTGKDLADHDFKGDDLRGAKFVNAKLKGADFTGANLQGADFTGSNYKEAKLDGADVRWVVYGDK